MTKKSKVGIYKNQRKQVALIIETSNEYARGLLKGIIKYTRENRGWSVFLGEQDRENTDLTWLMDWQGDGILARIENPEIANFIKNKNLPTIDLSSYRYIPSLPYVETEDRTFARIAADHLISKGFKNFAFCGNSKYFWSNQRGLHFRYYIDECGYSCYNFDSYQIDPSSFDERMMLVEWIKTLPKPIGIMACFDRQGQQLLEACRIAQILVPDDIAVIGVDNDEIICELSDPPLSSVMPNSIKTGYQAALLLDKMMNNQEIKIKKYLIEPLEIRARQSTDVLVTDDKYIAKAINFIRNHACDGISVKDVLEDIPLSRRIFEIRFFKCVGKTIHEEIVSAKLKYVKQLLSETDLTLLEIASKAGFKHAEYLSVAFKRELELSPSEYREMNRKT